MSDHQNIDSIILASIGITQEARKLAQQVYDLEETDPNIDAISFSRNTLPGYAGAPFLIADVQLQEPFTHVEEFRSYLQKHHLPSENNNIMIEDTNPQYFSFQTHGGTTDAFCAQFYQPYRIRAGKE